MSPSDVPINWKRNLTVTWLGCFLTGAAFSLVMPFLPLYVEQLGVTGHSALNMWSGLVFSITFLFSAIASPFWGGLADRKGRKIMLLRSALGMAIVMLLMGMAQNIWQFLRDRSADNTAAAAQGNHHYAHREYTHLIPHFTIKIPASRRYFSPHSRPYPADDVRPCNACGFRTRD